MGVFDRCLLVADVDGTLIHNGEIIPSNIEAARYFVDEGGLFTIASGRSIEAVRPLDNIMRCNCGVICFNGATIYDYNAETVLNEITLPEIVKPAVYSLIKRFPNVGAEIHHGRKLYVINSTAEIEEHLKYESLIGEKINFDRAGEIDWTKVLFSTNQIDIMNEFIAAADNENIGDAYFLRTSNIYYELTCREANKANGINCLRKILGEKIDKVFAIGDYFNDVEMIKAADIGAAVFEAPQEIKNISDYVAGKCCEGSVADFVKYLSKLMVM